MADAAARETEKILNGTIRRLRALYADTNREIRNDVDFDSLYLDDDEATQRERIRHAEKNNLDEVIAVIVALILATNERAIQTINGTLDGVYATNFEHSARKVAASVAQPSFNLKDALSKYTKRAYRRETSFRHVSNEIEKALKNALRQGKGIKDIAREVQKVTNRSRTSALTTARTETFRIANESRFELAQQAAATGLTVTKTWMHNHIGQKTVRDWHVRMSGETVAWDEPFSNGLMQPLDVDAPAEETINCRCWMELRVVD